MKTAKQTSNEIERSFRIYERGSGQHIQRGRDVNLLRHETARTASDAIGMYLDRAYPDATDEERASKNLADRYIAIPEYNVVVNRSQTESEEFRDWLDGLGHVARLGDCNSINGYRPEHNDDAREIMRALWDDYCAGY